MEMYKQNEALDNEQIETVKKFTPRVVFNGICAHNYEDIGVDPEGYKKLRCSKCPMGKREKAA